MTQEGRPIPESFWICVDRCCRTDVNQLDGLYYCRSCGERPYRYDLACLCGSTDPDSFGNRDQVVHPQCPRCAPDVPDAA